MEWPEEQAHRDAHNRREFHRIWRAVAGYGAPAVALGFGAYFASGALRVVLVALAGVLFVIASWIGLWAVGASLLVRATRRTR